MSGRLTDMKPNSFKLKIALFSVFTFGCVLIAFALLFRSVVNRIGLQRIDRELQIIGDAQIRGPRSDGHWMHFDNTLASIYGTKKESWPLIKVNNQDGHSVYTSLQWPREVTASQLGIVESEGIAPDSIYLSPKFFPRIFEKSHGRPENMHIKQPRWITIKSNGQAWRFVIMANEHTTLVIGIDLVNLSLEIHQLQNTLLFVAPLALILLALGGWFLARQALRPINSITEVASGITAQELSKRIKTGDTDLEFQALITVINGMLNRLEKSFLQSARFSSDAAHELKTPLTILQGQLEQSIRDAPEGSAEQCNYVGLVEEVQRLKTIVRKLLLLAQSDSGQLKLSPVEIDLSEEIDNLCNDVQVQAPEVALRKDIVPDINVIADYDLLRLILNNLASNAMKYNREGGYIGFGLEIRNDKAVFTITNSIAMGAKINKEHIFDRFYRSDKSRSRLINGTGLGLSLSREIAHAHSGDLILKKLETDLISFELTLFCAKIPIKIKNELSEENLD